MIGIGRALDLPVRRPVIVVVDDEDDLRGSLVVAMRKRAPCFDVRDAANADQARALLDIAPDLLISDLRMPGVSGVGLAIDAGNRHPGLRVLIMTAYAIDPPALATPQAYSYLEKPFELPLFFATVDLVLFGYAPPARTLRDVARLCGVGRFSGCIVMKRGRERGHARFDFGLLSAVSAGGLEGPAAFRELASWTDARFEMEQGFRGDDRSE